MENRDPIVEIEIETLQPPGPNFFKIGLILTGLYLLFVLGSAFFAAEKMVAMAPNEWGDFLAGVFGPMALLWVVMGFLQQGVELRYSRNALLLQARELKESVEAQKSMSEAAWESVKIEENSIRNLESEKASSIKPVFMIGKIVGSDIEWKNITEVSLYLINLGKDAFNLEIDLLGDGSLMSTRSFFKFSSEQQTNVAIRLRQDWRDDQSCRLHLKYNDIRGNPLMHEFELRKGEKGVEVSSPLGQSLRIT